MSDTCVRCGDPIGELEEAGRNYAGEPCHGRLLTCVEHLRQRCLVAVCAFCGATLPREGRAVAEHMLTCEAHPMHRAVLVAESALGLLRAALDGTLTAEQVEQARGLLALRAGADEGGAVD